MRHVLRLAACILIIVSGSAAKDSATLKIATHLPWSSEVTPLLHAVGVAPQTAPAASKLSECSFPNGMKPGRVDNTCKAILDDVAKNLQQNPDSKLVIVGHAAPTEKRKNLAAARAVNAKVYLTGGEAKQGIDPGRIEARTGRDGAKTVEFWLLPPGATFSDLGTQSINEQAIKPVN